MTYLMAVQAGVDIVDTALSPLANGTSQPSTEALVATLEGTERDTGLDLNKLSEVAAHFREVATGRAALKDNSWKELMAAIEALYILNAPEFTRAIQ